jgi:hypothetical protein
MNRLLITSLLTGLATSALAQQNVPQTDQQAAREVHMQFTTAFNRQDAAGIASLFAEDGIRVTPRGSSRVATPFRRMRISGSSHGFTTWPSRP